MRQGDIFCFPARDGIRASVAFRGLGDLYKRHPLNNNLFLNKLIGDGEPDGYASGSNTCFLYKSEAADVRQCVLFGGCTKKKEKNTTPFWPGPSRRFIFRKTVFF